MTPELRHLRYFVAVAEELSFTRAAQRLHIAQPSLSAQIAELERQVGCQLLRRTTRKVELTKAGESLARSARRLLAEAERAVQVAREVAQTTRRPLRVDVASAAVDTPRLALERLAVEVPDIEREGARLPPFLPTRRELIRRSSSSSKVSTTRPAGTRRWATSRPPGSRP